MSKKKVVKYPGGIKKVFYNLETICKFVHDSSSIKSIVEKANLPKKTLFQIGNLITDDDDDVGTMVSILLSTGEIFSGVAIRNPADKYDFDMATIRATGRAVAVYRACVKPIDISSGVISFKDIPNIPTLGGLNYGK